MDAVWPECLTEQSVASTVLDELVPDRWLVLVEGRDFSKCNILRPGATIPMGKTQTELDAIQGSGGPPKVHFLSHDKLQLQRYYTI